MPAPRLIVVCGLPATGKTTVASALAQERLVERCRVDGAAKLPPELDERFFVDRFDYAAEDDYLARPPR